MARPSFATAPADLIEYLEASYDYFTDHGYTAKAGSFEVGFPNTPSFICKRGGGQLYVEVSKRLNPGRIKAWTGYCSSQPRDSRFGIVVPRTLNISAANLIALRKTGIGLYLADANGVVEQIGPRDLAVNYQFPPVKQPLRRSLGPIQEKCERGDWLGGYGDACQLLEDKARGHLVWLLAHGNEVLDKNGQPRALSRHAIHRMTLGGVLDAYKNLKAPTNKEVQVTRALGVILKSRNDHTHRRNRVSVQNRLRKNLGSHLWVVVGALELV